MVSLSLYACIYFIMDDFESMTTIFILSVRATNDDGIHIYLHFNILINNI